MPQGPGWACFHCGDVFLTQGEAEDHFGFSGYEDAPDNNPACVERLNFDEKSLRSAMMDMFRELEREREANDELEEALASQGAIPVEVLRGHYLSHVTCNEETHRDNPVCACSTVNLGWHLSVGDAVEAWIQHVIEEARKAPR